MYSKAVRAPIFGLALALVSVLVACGLNTGEKAPVLSPPSHSGAGFNCLTRIPEHVDLYLNAKLSEKEISDFSYCMQRALTTFAQLTRGREESTYAPEEIRDFLEEYFIRDRKISDGLLREFMALKKAIVGGSETRISRAELYTGVEILEDIRKESIRLRPHMAFLNPKLARKQDPAVVGRNLRSANEALKLTIKTFTKRLRASREGYPLVRLRGLLTEMRGFLRWESHFTNSSPVGTWIELFAIFRELSIGPKGGAVIRVSDWTPLLESASRWYLAYLEFEIGVKNKAIFYGYGLQNTVQLASGIFSLLEDSISRQPSFTISTEQVMRLVRALSELGWIPSYIRLTSIEKTLDALFIKIFGDPSVLPSQRRGSGMNLMTLARMQEHFYRWGYVQMHLDTRYRGLRGDSDVPKLQEAPYLPGDLAAKLKVLRGSEWDDFMAVKIHMRPLFADGSYRVTIAPLEKLNELGVKHEFHNLSMMNLFRTVVALAFRGYAENFSPTHWESGIGETDLQEFYVDVRDMGVDLGLVDSRNLNAGKRSFLEGNLFNYSSDGISPDGKSKLKFSEAMELFAFLFSGGSMAGELYTALSDPARGCKRGPLDLLGVAKLDRTCVLQTLPDVLGDQLNHLPDLQAFLKNTDPKTRAHYLQTLLSTAYSPMHSDPEWVERSELSTLSVVIHYAETVLTRFDRTVNGVRDGALDNEEVELAVPLFRGFIQKFAHDSLGGMELSDSSARGAFYYILVNKQMPLSRWQKYWSVPFESIWSSSVYVDRYELSTVFKVIIAKIFEAGAAKSAQAEAQAQAARAGAAPGAVGKP